MQTAPFDSVPVSDPAARRRLYDSRAFEHLYHYDGPLGAQWTPDATRFALWAPTAQAVQLCLYPDGGGSPAARTLELHRAGHGVWQCEVPGNWDGCYYDYTVTDFEGTARRTADPWALACGRDGGRSMVVDLRRTDPAGWAQDRPPAPMKSTCGTSPGMRPAACRRPCAANTRPLR